MVPAGSVGPAAQEVGVERIGRTTGSAMGWVSSRDDDATGVTMRQVARTVNEDASSC